MMKQPGNNIILMKQSDLPPGSFISYEAVEWAINYHRIPEVSQAIALFADMLKEGLVVHASLSKKVPFVFGFYLYCIVDPKSSPPGINFTVTPI